MPQGLYIQAENVSGVGGKRLERMETGICLGKWTDGYSALLGFLPPSGIIHPNHYEDKRQGKPIRPFTWKKKHEMCLSVKCKKMILSASFTQSIAASLPGRENSVDEEGMKGGHWWKRHVIISWCFLSTANNVKEWGFTACWEMRTGW